MALLKEFYNPFKSQPRKTVKHTQTIHRLLPTNCLSVFDHFVGLALKRLTKRATSYSAKTNALKLIFPSRRNESTDLHIQIRANNCTWNVCTANQLRGVYMCKTLV